MSVLVWFRRDLRITDNPALEAAYRSGKSILPLFIESSGKAIPWRPGSASRWWLHYSLSSLDASLRKRGSRLILRKGNTVQEVLLRLLGETQVEAVYWNRLDEPQGRDEATAITEALKKAGVETREFRGQLLHDPERLLTAGGTPFKVFTPFWNRLQASLHSVPTLAAPSKLKAPDPWPQSLCVDELQLLPSRDWAAGLRENWTPGEAGARAHLRRFLQGPLEEYLEARDRPSLAGTSRLSPHLHFGEISPRMLWNALEDAPRETAASAISYRRELAWREFAHHLLRHFPATPENPLRPAFEKFPWRRSPKDLRAWQKGLTGYPLVDAGMRELWHTGWMHNRVRMIAASFLVKHLLIDWQEGARWFWDTLVDADLANNTLGWQWVAGCGADAAPYFRIFNPVTQGEKFDPQGAYVKRWVPELARLPVKHLHAPWEAPASALKEAGVLLGKDYPKPMVDHRMARERALAAFASIRK